MSEVHQLRVRLDPSLRDKLLQLSETRGRGETLSDLVREAIEAFLAPGGLTQDDAEFVINSEAKCTIKRLAKELQRAPHYVIEDCIQGIIDFAETEKSPLIILELKLRRKYFATKSQFGDDQPV